jgi:hypothetical protein
MFCEETGNLIEVLTSVSNDAPTPEFPEVGNRDIFHKHLLARALLYVFIRPQKT